MLAQIFNHVQQAISRIFQMFRQSSTVINKAAVWGSEAQELETAFFQLLNDRDPSVAAGDQLDKIGRLVNAPPRGVLSDVEYRKRVQASIVRNNSQGQHADIIKLLLALHPGWTGFSEPFTKQDYGAAYINECAFEYGSVSYITGLAPGLMTADDAHETARFGKQTAAAGVRPILLYRLPDNTTGLAFTFAGPSQELGFSVGKFAAATEGKLK